MNSSRDIIKAHLVHMFSMASAGTSKVTAKELLIGRNKHKYKPPVGHMGLIQLEVRLENYFGKEIDLTERDASTLNNLAKAVVRTLADKCLDDFFPQTLHNPKIAQSVHEFAVCQSVMSCPTNSMRNPYKRGQLWLTYSWSRANKQWVFQEIKHEHNSYLKQNERI